MIVYDSFQTNKVLRNGEGGLMMIWMVKGEEGPEGKGVEG